jgi:hypothetical protein
MEKSFKILLSHEQLLKLQNGKNKLFDEEKLIVDNLYINQKK